MASNAGVVPIELSPPPIVSGDHVECGADFQGVYDFVGDSIDDDDGKLVVRFEDFCLFGKEFWGGVEKSPKKGGGRGSEKNRMGWGWGGESSDGRMLRKGVVGKVAITKKA